MKKLANFLSALLLSASSLLVIATPSAMAAVDSCTWTGGGGDLNFSTSGNWNCSSDGASAVPGNGDTIILDSGALSANKTLNNDLSNLSVAAITILNVGSYQFTINGNALTLTGNITNPSNRTLIIGANVTLGGPVTIGGQNGVRFDGSLALGANALTIGATTYLEGTLSGSGAITVNATESLLIYSISNSYSGSITVNGELSMDNPSSLSSATSITVADNAQLALGSYGLTGEQTFDVPITLNGDGITGEFPQGALFVEFDENVTTMNITHLTLNANSTYGSFGTADQKAVLTATLNDHTMTRLDGSQGKMTLNGQVIDSNYYTTTYKSPDDDDTGTPDDTTVGDKEKIVYNNQTTENVTIAKGGIVAGKGKVGTITIQDGGHLAPGESPGCLSSGNLTFVAGAVYDFELGGVDACTGYDQMKVTGTVTLGNGTLNTILYNGFKPVKGQSYIIIENDGTDAVSGTFANLAEGATLTVSGYAFKVSYVGGTGNDVGLTVLSVPSTGFSLIISNPITTLAASSLVAGALIILSKKYRSLAKR